MIPFRPAGSVRPTPFSCGALTGKGNDCPVPSGGGTVAGVHEKDRRDFLQCDFFRYSRTGGENFRAGRAAFAIGLGSSLCPFMSTRVGRPCEALGVEGVPLES